MSTFNISLNTANTVAYVSMGTDALSNSDNVLADFKHDGEATDEVHANEANHVLYHHVRDLLYAEGVLNMQAVSIVKEGNNILSTGFYAVPQLLTAADAATVAFVVKHKNNDAVAADLVVVIDDELIATYTFPGSVHTITGQAVGTTFATITSTALGFSLIIPIIITA